MGVSGSPAGTCVGGGDAARIWRALVFAFIPRFLLFFVFLHCHRPPRAALSCSFLCVSLCACRTVLVVVLHCLVLLVSSLWRKNSTCLCASKGF